MVASVLLLSPFIEHDILGKPITCTTLLVMTIAYLYMFNYNTAFERVAYQYDAVVVKREFWRSVTASYSHLTFLHIAFNSMSLWQLSTLESMLGSVQYTIDTLLLLFGSIAVLTLISHALIAAGRPQYHTSYSVGYSCVVFGLMCIDACHTGLNTTYSLFGLIDIPVLFTPFLSLTVTTLLVPNASFIGHLSGIVIGYAIGFTEDYWRYNSSSSSNNNENGSHDHSNIIAYVLMLLLLLLIGAVIHSMHKTTIFQLPLINRLVAAAAPSNNSNNSSNSNNNSISSITIVNGNIIYKSAASAPEAQV